MTHSEDVLQVLLDRQSVTDVLYKSARCLDEQRWEEWSHALTDDVVIELPYAKRSGISGLVDWTRSNLEQYSATVHMLTNVEVSFSDPDHAVARANLWTARIPRGGSRDDHLDDGGYYEWTLRREDQEWRISSLRLNIVWVTGHYPDSVPTSGDATPDDDN